MENISKHISYKEATHSNTATRRGIDNTPGKTELAAMKLVAEKVFQPAREHFNKPIKINSFFRSATLNKRIGGSTTSQHCKGEAIDLDAVGFTNKELYEYIKENLVFDQLIWEFGTDNEPDWVHVSYTANRENRGEILQAKKQKGKTIYVKLK